jgi:hypothetical protein
MDDEVTGVDTLALAPLAGSVLLLLFLLKDKGENKHFSVLLSETLRGVELTGFDMSNRFSQHNYVTFLKRRYL